MYLQKLLDCCCSDRHRRSPQKRDLKSHLYHLRAILKFDVTEGVLQEVGTALQAMIEETWRQLLEYVDTTFGPDILVLRDAIVGDRERKTATGFVTGISYPVPTQFGWTFTIPMSVDLNELSEVIRVQIKESIPDYVAKFALTLEDASITVLSSSRMELVIELQHVKGIGQLVNEQIQARLSEALSMTSTTSRGVVSAGMPEALSDCDAVLTSDIKFVVPLTVKLKVFSQLVEEEIRRQASDALPNLISLIRGLVVSLDSVILEPDVPHDHRSPVRT